MSKNRRNQNNQTEQEVELIPTETELRQASAEGTISEGTIAEQGDAAPPERIVETIQEVAQEVSSKESAEHIVQVEGNLAVDPFYVPEPKKSEEEVKSEEFITKARSYTTQSARVRFLTSQGLTRGQIVKIYPQLYGRTILYQHVRNILVTPVSTTQ